MIVGHSNPTEFTITPTTPENSPPLAPITLTVYTGSAFVSTYWTVDQAVEFAQELVTLAGQVSAAQAGEVAA